ncbi:hypothetical protein [Streptomyces sp. IBSBF 3136]
MISSSGTSAIGTDPVSAVSGWSGYGMTFAGNRMMLRAMPTTTVVGEC